MPCDDSPLDPADWTAYRCHVCGQRIGLARDGWLYLRTLDNAGVFVNRMDYVCCRCGATGHLDRTGVHLRRVWAARERLRGAWEGGYIDE